MAIYLVILHENKKLPPGRLFLKGAGVGIIVDSVDVMAELGLFRRKYTRMKKNKGLWKKREPKKKEKTAKEAGRRKRGHQNEEES